MINDNDYEFESDSEDSSEEECLIIAAAATAAIAAGLCAMEYVQDSTALDGVKESLDIIGNLLHELASERKFRQLPLDARADAGHEQGGKAEHRQETKQRVQQIETHLDASRVTALADLVAKDTNAANAYMLIAREDCRHAWVALKLKEMGFVEGISI